MNRRPVFLITCLCFGFAFFYIPILSIIVFSFNKSRLVSVWGGFSTQWYGKLFENDQIIEAAKLSLSIALVSATIATILGTMAGIALARFKRFRGRTLFSGLVTAPLIMPEIITGISSLMLFILMADWLARRARLYHRHHRAHHLLDDLCHHNYSRAAIIHRYFDRRSRLGSRIAALAGLDGYHSARHRSCLVVGVAARLHDFH